MKAGTQPVILQKKREYIQKIDLTILRGFGAVRVKEESSLTWFVSLGA